MFLFYFILFYRILTKRSNPFSRGETLHSEKKKEKKEDIAQIGSELEVPVDAGLEKLKIIFRWKDG